MKSSRKLTTLANTLFWFNGIVCLLPGVVLIHIAGSFQVDTHIIGYIYTLFTLGNITAVQCNGRLLEKTDIRLQLLLVAALVAASIIGLASVGSLPVFAFCVFGLGVGNGFFSSTASYMIVHLYDNKDRSSRLSLLHFFFSIGAIISPLLSGALLANGIGWQSIYLLVLPLLACVLLLVWFTPVRLSKRQQQHTDKNKSVKLTLSVYAIAVSLFCYMIAEGSFMFWGNTYFIEYLAVDATQAGFLISVFWFFMAAGRILSGLILRRVNAVQYILFCSGIAFAAFMVLVNNVDYFTVLAAVSLMGLGFSGLYACILSYGTLQLPYPSAALMSLYITFGSLGGLTASPFSSWLKHSFSLQTALLISGSFMAVVFFLIGGTVLSAKRKEKYCQH
ncbi:MFS transporter [Sporomusa sp.]|jgi:fucose permease|uniref:MFS transporter n=1 Tax=Sporomusa sp. TaxID=2078658 RepID=UPI002C81AF9B|nr:MFS transporter [Sporomusa sp.]HWR09499.1 MFS transporter [Sporomusa sp.]